VCCTRWRWDFLSFSWSAPSLPRSTRCQVGTTDRPRVRSSTLTRVTRPGGADFVPIPERIATFDNDGTLWSEQPIYFQFAFALDRVKALAPQHPDWKTTQPFKAVLDGDMKALAASGEKGLVELLLATHTGMSTEDFAKAVAAWMASARHPRFKRPYTDLVRSRPTTKCLAFGVRGLVTAFDLRGDRIHTNAPAAKGKCAGCERSKR
jgi:hypothetical protein